MLLHQGPNHVVARGTRRPLRAHTCRIRAQQTSSHAPSPPSLRGQVLVNGRQAMEGKHPLESFTIAGVTFEGRQKLIQALQPNALLMLQREPWNTHDGDAVDIVDLVGGQRLGYVPSKNRANTRFTQEAVFGLVASVGPEAKTGNWGAKFYVRPQLPCLLLDVLPPAHGQEKAAAGGTVSVARAMLGERWAGLEAAALEAAKFRCELTGVPSNQLPLAAVPVWRYNAADRAVQLVRLLCVVRPLADAKEELEGVLARRAAVGQGYGDLAAVAAAAAAAAAANGVATEGAALASASIDLYDQQAKEWEGVITRDAARTVSLINGFSAADTAQYLALVCRRAKELGSDWVVESLV